MLLLDKKNVAECNKKYNNVLVNNLDMLHNMSGACCCLLLLSQNKTRLLLLSQNKARSWSGKSRPLAAMGILFLNGIESATTYRLSWKV